MTDLYDYTIFGLNLIPQFSIDGVFSAIEGTAHLHEKRRRLKSQDISLRIEYLKTRLTSTTNKNDKNEAG